jgi:4-amino-4-deoxy-L-arabinose transferase-like glycosyltransferase
VNQEYIQIFTTFLFSITCVATFFIGKTLWNADVGFLAGSLLLGIPYLFSQLPLMLTDIPAMFFLTLSIYTFIKTMEKGGIWIFISSAAIFCAALSKYSAWMMLSVLPVIFIVCIEESGSQITHPLPPYLRGMERYSRPQIRKSYFPWHFSYIYRRSTCCHCSLLQI